MRPRGSDGDPRQPAAAHPAGSLACVLIGKRDRPDDRKADIDPHLRRAPQVREVSETIFANINEGYCDYRITTGLRRNPCESMRENTNLEKWARVVKILAFKRFGEFGEE